MRSSSFLSCSQIAVQLGNRTILKNFSARIEKQSLTVLLGENGSGKTTLLKLFAQILTPLTGTMELPAADTTVAYIAAEPAWMADQSVEQNFEMYAKAILKRGPTRAEIEKACNEVGLQSRGQQQVATLSTGQKKRLILAILNFTRPQLILLDEPTNGLDTGGKELAISCLKTLHESGATLVIATHDPELADAASHIIELKTQ